eukprot:4648638-Pleurochrysis_carterae.AAC.1
MHARAPRVAVGAHACMRADVGARRVGPGPDPRQAGGGRFGEGRRRGAARSAGGAALGAVHAAHRGAGRWMPRVQGGQEAMGRHGRQARSAIGMADLS